MSGFTDKIIKKSDLFGISKSVKLSQMNRQATKITHPQCQDDVFRGNFGMDATPYYKYTKRYFVKKFL